MANKKGLARIPLSIQRELEIEYDKRQLEKHEREFRRKESEREYAKLLEAARQKPITDYVNTGDYLIREYIGKVIILISNKIAK